MIKDNGRRLTPKQYLKQHPEKYVMLSHELFEDGSRPIYISEAPKDAGLFAVGTSWNREDAIVWSSLDNTPTKLEWHKAKTGLKQLKFERVQE